MGGPNLPIKVEIYPLGQTTMWQWRATFPDGEVEISPENYLSRTTAKFIARMCYPGAMLLVLK